MNPDATIHLTISSDPGAFGVVRAVAARSGAVADLTLEEIDDVCLAVDEAALQLIGAGADRVRISIETTGEGLTAEFRASGEMGPGVDSADGAIGRHILAALVDELEITDSVVRFAKRRMSR